MDIELSTNETERGSRIMGEGESTILVDTTRNVSSCEAMQPELFVYGERKGDECEDGQATASNREGYTTRDWSVCSGFVHAITYTIIPTETKGVEYFIKGLCIINNDTKCINYCPFNCCLATRKHYHYMLKFKEDYVKSVKNKSGYLPPYIKGEYREVGDLEEYNELDDEFESIRQLDYVKLVKLPVIGKWKLNYAIQCNLKSNTRCKRKLNYASSIDDQLTESDLKKIKNFEEHVEAVFNKEKIKEDLDKVIDVRLNDLKLEGLVVRLEIVESKLKQIVDQIGIIIEVSDSLNKATNELSKQLIKYNKD